MPLVTAKELHKAQGIPAGTTYRLAKAGLIPSYRVGVRKKGIRFCAEEVLAALRQPASTEKKNGDGR